MYTTLSAAYLRLWSNMRSPVMRRNVALLMTGKLIGLAIIFGLIYWGMLHVAHAADTTIADETSQINAINTAWTLIAAFLVFAMQVGFVMLEAGFARERESVNILVEGIADTCSCGVLFWAIGFAFMFEDGNRLIGTHGLIGRLFKRRWRRDAATQRHPGRRRRFDPLVRLVWVQPRQYAVGPGRAGDRPHFVQHHAGRMHGWSGLHLLFLRSHAEMGPWPDG